MKTRVCLIGLVSFLVWIRVVQVNGGDDSSWQSAPTLYKKGKTVLFLDELNATDVETHRGWNTLFSLRSVWKGKAAPGSVVVLKKGLTLAAVIDEPCYKRNAIHAQDWWIPEMADRERGSREQTNRLTLLRDMDPDLFEQKISEDPCIKKISNIRKAGVEAVDQTDPMLAQQAYLSTIEAFASYPFFFARTEGIRRPVVLAVVDTGLDLMHPDLRENVWVNAVEQSGKPGIDDDRNGYIDDLYGYDFPEKTGDPSHQIANDHGTHVAGLAAGVSTNGIGISGVMGRMLRIMSLNVFGRNWSADTVDIDRAIRYAADQGAQVINVSVGGQGHSETTRDAIVYAGTKGSFVVISAGNEGIDIDREFYFPASYARELENAVAVGALNIRKNELCDFSNYGALTIGIAAPGCDPSAPGEGLLSTKKNSQYGYKKGTSMAAPQVAAAAALVYAWTQDHYGRRPTMKSLKEALIKESNEAPLLKGKTNGRVISLKRLAERLAVQKK